MGSALKGGVDAALFGDRVETGQNLHQDQLDALQQMLDRFVPSH